MTHQFDHGPGSLPGRCFMAGKHERADQAADGFVIHVLAALEPPIHEVLQKIIVPVRVLSPLRNDRRQDGAHLGLGAIAADILGQWPIGRRRQIDAPAKHGVLLPKFAAGALLKVLAHQSITRHILHQPADFCRDVDYAGFAQAIQPGLNNILHDMDVLHHLLMGERRI